MARKSTRTPAPAPAPAPAPVRKSRLTAAQMLAAQQAQIDTLVESVNGLTSTLAALLARDASAVPTAQAPAAKPARKSAPARKPARKSAPAPATPAPETAGERLNWHGHVVTVEPSYQQASTGWKMRRVTVFDGEALHDHSSDERRKAVNGLLPCSVIGCVENRTGNNALCKAHKASKRPAHLAWLAAGSPKTGSPEWRSYMGFRS